MLRIRSRLYSTWSYASWRHDSAKRCGSKTIVGWYWQSDEWLGCLERDVGRAADTAAIFGRENQWVFARGKEKPFVLVWCSGEFCRSKKGGRPFCVERFLVCLFFLRERTRYRESSCRSGGVSFSRVPCMGVGLAVAMARRVWVCVCVVVVCWEPEGLLEGGFRRV